MTVLVIAKEISDAADKVMERWGGLGGSKIVEVIDELYPNTGTRFKEGIMELCIDRLCDSINNKRILK